MRQVEFAEALVSFSGRASRETVSRWENLDAEGKPRARMGRRNAEALAALVRAHGFSLTADLFLEHEEATILLLARQQIQIAAQLDEVLKMLRELRSEVRRLRPTDREHDTPRREPHPRAAVA
jgi:hypothetical protein